MQEALFRKRKKKKNRTGRKGFFYHSAKKIPIQLWSIKEWTFRISRIGDDSKDLRPPTSLPFCLLTLEFPEALRFKETKYPLGSWGRMDTCLCMTESLHSSPETITTLFVNQLHPSTKYNVLKNKTKNKVAIVTDKLHKSSPPALVCKGILLYLSKELRFLA